jgi:hypothetical protein
MPEAMVIAAMDDEGWAIFKHCNSPAGSSQMGCCEGHMPNALVFWPGNASATSATFCESIVSTVAPLKMDGWEHVSVAVDVEFGLLDISFDGVTQALTTVGDDSISTRLASFASHVSDASSSRGMGIGMRPGCKQDCMNYHGLMAAVRVWNSAVSPVYRGFSENAIPKEDAHHLVGSYRIVEGRDSLAPNAAIGHGRANDMQLINVFVNMSDDSSLVLPAGYGVPAPSAFVFDGNTTIVVEENAATVALMPTDGSMTFEAWIRPDDVVSQPTVEVLATMGDWGWTLILTGSHGGGSDNNPNVPYDTLAFFEGSPSSNVWDSGDIHNYTLSNETVTRGV